MRDRSGRGTPGKVSVPPPSTKAPDPPPTDRVSRAEFNRLGRKWEKEADLLRAERDDAFSRVAALMAPVPAGRPAAPDPAVVAHAIRELRTATECTCPAPLPQRGVHASNCMDPWRDDVDTLAAEVERLRARTHEIQAQEMAKRADLDRQLAEWRQRWDLGKSWWDDADESSRDWHVTSYVGRVAVMRLVAERAEALAEVERLRRVDELARALVERYKRLSPLELDDIDGASPDLVIALTALADEVGR